MGGGWGINPQKVREAGSNIGGNEESASTAAKSFLESLTEGAGAVHHDKLKSALKSYESLWDSKANGLSKDVKGLGSRVEKTGTTGGQADHDGNTEAKRTGSQAEGYQTRVCRPVNG